MKRFFSSSSVNQVAKPKASLLYTGSTEYHDERIDQKHSPRRLARKLLKHNQKTHFTPVLWIGQSGTGKSKGMNTLAHWVHTIARNEYGLNFKVLWMEPDTLVNIEHLLITMPKEPTIIIYDDLSNELEKYPPKIRKQVFKALTTIRHTMGAPVFVFSAIHYSKALDKPLRNVPYLILTSISDEEFANIDQLWGYRQTGKIQEFFTKFEATFERDTFKMYVDGEDKDFLTDKPFRPQLVKRIKECHFLLNDAVSCHACKNPKDVIGKEDISAEQFYNTFVSKYNTRANNVLMYWLYINGVPEALARDYRSAWNSLNKLFSKYQVDKKALSEVLYIHRGQDKKQHRGRKKKLSNVENEWMSIIQQNLKSNTENKP